MRKIKIFILFLFFANFAEAAQNQKTCTMYGRTITASPPRINVSVKNNKYKIVVLSREELQLKSNSSRGTVVGLHEPALTNLITNSEMTVSHVAKNGEDVEACIKIDSIDFTLDLGTGSTIYIDNTTQVGGCKYNIIMEHEKKHAANFYRYLNNVTADVKNNFNVNYLMSTKANNTEYLNQQLTAFKQMYNEEVGKYMQFYIDKHSKELDMADSIVDSDAEMQKEYAQEKNCKN